MTIHADRGECQVDASQSIDVIRVRRPRGKAGGAMRETHPGVRSRQQVTNPQTVRSRAKS